LTKIDREVTDDLDVQLDDALPAEAIAASSITSLAALQSEPPGHWPQMVSALHTGHRAYRFFARLFLPSVSAVAPQVCRFGAGRLVSFGPRFVALVGCAMGTIPFAAHDGSSES